MGDKFIHPDGKKAQDVRLRGGKLVRSGIKFTGGSASPESGQPVSENVRRRNQLLEDSYSASGGRAGTVGQKKSGVSGYRTPKNQVEEGLDEAGEMPEEPEEG